MENAIASAEYRFNHRLWNPRLISKECNLSFQHGKVVEFNKSLIIILK